MTDNRDKLGNKWEGFFRPILFFLMPIILILIGVQSHFSASILIIAVVSIMMLMAGTKLRNFLIFGTIFGSLGIGAMYAVSKILKIGTFRFTRFVSFLDPWADATGTGWQVIQGLYAIGSGRTFWGRPWK